MNLSGNTILITGGATGIGRAMAERFLAAGSEVIVCGRRADKLQEAKERLPKLHTIVCDVGRESERIRLFDEVTRQFPHLNVLVNNAGIQRRGKLMNDQESWSEHQREIAINLEAPIHLCLLFLPTLQKQSHPAIINVTSGLAFTPLPGAAIYSATKAALHSFTLSLRAQVAPAGLGVLEVVPPAVNTDLGGAGLHTWGVPLDEFADAIMAGLARGEQEVGYGTSEKARKATREEIEEAVKRMASLIP